jgi:hypothetical protein
MMVRRQADAWLLAVAMALILDTSPICAAPRWVALTDEIRSASTVAIVRIDSYAKNRLLCTRQPDGAPLALKYASSDTTWNPPQPVRSESDSMWALGATSVADNRAVWTAAWPPVGSEAVVVCDSTERISLFARHVGGGWRFWSPHVTLSVALFACDPSALLLKPDYLNKGASWDGCIVPDSLARRWLR